MDSIIVKENEQVLFEFDKLPKRARWVNVVLFPVKFVQVCVLHIYILSVLFEKNTLIPHV